MSRVIVHIGLHTQRDWGTDGDRTVSKSPGGRNQTHPTQWNSFIAVIEVSSANMEDHQSKDRLKKGCLPRKGVVLCQGGRIERVP